MKKTYLKPVMMRREVLSRVTAAAGSAPAGDPTPG